MHLSFDVNSGYRNHCVLEQLAQSYLPSERAIYLRTFPWPEKAQDLYIKALKAANLDVLDAVPALESSLDDWRDWRVSQKEGHPSAAANIIYADVLFTKIAYDPKYEFGEEYLSSVYEAK